MSEFHRDLAELLRAAASLLWLWVRHPSLIAASFEDWGVTRRSKRFLERERAAAEAAARERTAPRRRSTSSQ